ncbi:MAG TPA: hypothetical protein ENN36_04440 [Candidatus Bathyarchaeota archaeon]|nr:hypothetical protein [Candidatus Bathyarchaeota archaeon]
MKVDAKRAVFVGFAVFILLLTATSAAADENEFQVESTHLQIYRDGLVRVTQTLSVNETLPEVSLPLLHSSADNFIVLDENQTVLDYEVDGTNLTVFTLGATSVSLQYDTDSLTRKDFEVWTFLVDTPYNLTVQLPAESTVVYLNQLPTAIDTEDTKITLSLFPSQWEISYVFPLTSPAEFQISDLNVTPSEVEAGKEVTISVKIANVGGQTGSYTIQLIINQTVEDTKTLTLEEGASTTTQFKIVKQTPGKYNIEIGGLVGEFTVNEASSNGSHSGMIPLEYFVVAAVAVAAIILVIYFLFRRRSCNVEKIFKMNPQLNQEEKDVIQFLAENEGKAFESQIRERFPDIPRTSLWRLVKRLEKLEIIRVKKIGLENQVELKK